jgi:hypothetical protein
LAEIDRTGADGQRRHLREDGRDERPHPLDERQLGSHAVSVRMLVPLITFTTVVNVINGRAGRRQWLWPWPWL